MVVAADRSCDRSYVTFMLPLPDANKIGLDDDRVALLNG